MRLRITWLALAVAVLVLVALAALLLATYSSAGGAVPTSPKTGGAAEGGRVLSGTTPTTSSSPTTTHHLGEALREVRKTHGEAESLGRPPPELLAGRPPPPVAAVEFGRPGGGRVEGGRALPKPKKPWTSYKTWAALSQDLGAVAEYWQDVNTTLDELDLDWSDVRRELAEKLYDDREWAGRINIVKGKPKIVELVPSPYRMGEGPLEAGMLAIVPAEVMEKLENKPAMFIFHTHPGESAGAMVPSPSDLEGSIMTALTGRFAADVIVSPFGVYLYTPSQSARREVWGDGAKSKTGKGLQTELIRTLRRTVDVLGAFGGARSWRSPWTLDEYAEVLRRYDFEYVVFPTDKYAWASLRRTYSMPSIAHDPSSIQEYNERIRRLEDEVEKEQIKTSEKRR